MLSGLVHVWLHVHCIFLMFFRLILYSACIHLYPRSIKIVVVVGGAGVISSEFKSGQDKHTTVVSVAAGDLIIA